MTGCVYSDVYKRTPIKGRFSQIFVTVGQIGKRTLCGVRFDQPSDIMELHQRAVWIILTAVYPQQQQSKMAAVRLHSQSSRPDTCWFPLTHHKGPFIISLFGGEKKLPHLFLMKGEFFLTLSILVLYNVPRVFFSSQSEQGGCLLLSRF